MFPDTTVLINFALVDEMRLLETLVAGNGSWSGSVASECDDQAEKQGLPKMLDAHQIFGEPLLLESQAEHVNLKLNQIFFRQAATNSSATHLGESETLAIVTTRQIASLVVSDDRGVADRIADLDATPTVQTTTSWHLFRIALWKRHITEDRLRQIRSTLLQHGRGCPAEVRNEASFTYWIKRPSPAS